MVMHENAAYVVTMTAVSFIFCTLSHCHSSSLDFSSSYSGVLINNYAPAYTHRQPSLVSTSVQPSAFKSIIFFFFCHFTLFPLFFSSSLNFLCAYSSYHNNYVAFMSYDVRIQNPLRYYKRTDNNDEMNTKKKLNEPSTPI